MLFVVSVPNEYGLRMKEEARLSGKKVKDIFCDMISARFGKTISSTKKDSIDRLFELARTAPHIQPSERWTRDDMQDNRGL